MLCQVLQIYIVTSGNLFNPKVMDLIQIFMYVEYKEMNIHEITFFIEISLKA